LLLASLAQQLSSQLASLPAVCWQQESKSQQMLQRLDPLPMVRQVPELGQAQALLLCMAQHQVQLHQLVQLYGIQQMIIGQRVLRVPKYNWQITHLFLNQLLN
jgi:hypothetical protein